MDQAELRAYLRDQFTGAEVRLDPLETPDQRITGEIWWDGFAGQGQLERQNLLWARLHDRFERDQLRAISLIFTLTPDEVEALARD